MESQEFKISAAHPRKVRILVKGHLRGIEQDVIQEMSVIIPASEPNNDGASIRLWEEISHVGGLVSKENEDTYHFFSLLLFSSITAEFQNIDVPRLIL